MEAKSLSEENKTHNQVLISSPRSKFLDEMIVSNGVLPNATVILPQYSSLTFFTIIIYLLVDNLYKIDIK